MRRNRSIPFKVKPKFAFVVDGECEFWYIQMLKRNERDLNVDLKPEIPQKKKLSEQYERVVSLSNDYDKVFWIIDFDVIIAETRTAKKGKVTALQEFKNYTSTIKKKYSNVKIIINNPCLEYWLLLHFEPTSKYFDSCDGATQQLKKHLKDYNKSQIYYTKQDNDIYLKLKAKLKTAIINANKLGDFSFENPTSGMSQMHLFFELEEVEKLTVEK